MLSKNSGESPFYLCRPRRREGIIVGTVTHNEKAQLDFPAMGYQLTKDAGDSAEIGRLKEFYWQFKGA